MSFHPRYVLAQVRHGRNAGNEQRFRVGRGGSKSRRPDRRPASSCGTTGDDPLSCGAVVDADDRLSSAAGALSPHLSPQRAPVPSEPAVSARHGVSGPRKQLDRRCQTRAGRTPVTTLSTRTGSRRGTVTDDPHRAVRAIIASTRISGRPPDDSDVQSPNKTDQPARQTSAPDRQRVKGTYSPEGPTRGKGQRASSAPARSAAIHSASSAV
jgi:hypothetical protein